ncbi:hypothetical protein [Rothia sp. 88186D007BW]
MSTTLNRRALVRGAAWAAPVVVAASNIPAMAASSPTGQLGVGTVRSYQQIFMRQPNNCNPTTNPREGFIDTLCCDAAVTPTDSNCLRDPDTSVGWWVESDPTTPGSVVIDTFTVTHTFSRPVTFTDAPLEGGGASTAGTTKWTNPTQLQPGWSIVSTTSTSITLIYKGDGTPVDMSDDVAGSGFCTGYFLNFREEVCSLSRNTLTTTRQAIYTDATGSHTVNWVVGPSRM